jgi:5-methylcytosine-specific restriction protein B
LPRLHGSRRRLEGLLRTFAEFCFSNNVESGTGSPISTFEPEDQDADQAMLPNSFDKLKRMLRSLRANQFTSFTE